MKIALATLCSPELAELGKLTHPNKGFYCGLHGYEYLTKLGDFLTDSPESGFHHLIFERWRWFGEMLPKFDWLLCCGVDVLITNPNITIESIVEGRKPFLICKDANGFNSDVILVKSDSECLNLMADIADSRPQFSRAPELDQSAMRSIFPKYPRTIEVLPQRVMNAYDYSSLFRYYGNPNYAKGIDADGNDGKWQPGDFIFHCPGLSQEEKIPLLKEKLRHVAIPT
jgi:hypothetical protein